MGTRSAIGYKTPEGKICAKYSHYDGYVSHTGAILEQYYQEVSKVTQMIDLGDQSYMDKEIFPKTSVHTFNTPETDVTVFYGRDRGESNVDAVEFETVQEFVEYYTCMDCEYFYLYTPAGWIVHDRYNVGKDKNGYPVFNFVETILLDENYTK
jgi:hypothetical protein